MPTDTPAIIISFDQFQKLVMCASEIDGLKADNARLHKQLIALHGLYSEVLQSLSELKEML